MDIGDAGRRLYCRFFMAGCVLPNRRPGSGTARHLRASISGPHCGSVVGSRLAPARHHPFERRLATESKAILKVVPVPPLTALATFRNGFTRTALRPKAITEKAGRALAGLRFFRPSIKRTVLRLIVIGIVLRAFIANADPGSALHFDGTNSYVNIPHAAALDAFPLTITAWIRTFRSARLYDGIVNKYSPGSGNGYSVHVYNGRLSAWYFRPGGLASVYPGDPGLDGGYVADGEWHHVTLVSRLGEQQLRDGIRFRNLFLVAEILFHCLQQRACLLNSRIRFAAVEREQNLSLLDSLAFGAFHFRDETGQRRCDFCSCCRFGGRARLRLHGAEGGHILSQCRNGNGSNANGYFCAGIHCR